MNYIYIYIIFINILSFIIYGIDKRKAIKHQYRISENTLILLAILGGSIGAYLSMCLFHHKTKHMKFTIGVPMIFLIQILLYLYLKFIVLIG